MKKTFRFIRSFLYANKLFSNRICCTEICQDEKISCAQSAKSLKMSFPEAH